MPRKKTDIIPAPTPNEFYLERQRRVQDSLRGRGDILPKNYAIRQLGRKVTLPSESRAPNELSLTWATLEERRIKDAPTAIDPKAGKLKLAKTADYVGTYYGYNGILRPEYDMLEPFVLVDTEPYLRQAINRKLSLMFRNGFEITSEQNRLADYIKRRLEAMAYVSNRTTEDFFKNILFQMSLCSNVFLRKIRDDNASIGVKREENSNKVPVAAYQVIPAHTIFPYLKRGVLEKWRRVYDTGMPFEDFSLEEIIHLKWDVKPGHIFGTPRTVGIRDDIFALRRLEENIELLFVNHLFPLFHVKVGTPDAPCGYYSDGSSEIDLVRQQIETMPKEGVFVTDERVEINTVGAEGKSLDTEKLIAHMKSRIYTGLGMSPIDMGESDTSNRSTAESVSQVLKDSIKNDLDTFGGQIRMHIFKEFFRETTMSLSLQGAVAETKIEWHEIDLDNKVKLENHTNQLYNSSLITHDEARQSMKKKPLEKPEYKNTHYEQHDKDLVTHTAKVNTESTKEIADHDAGLQKELLTHQTKETNKQAETTMALHKSEVEKEHGKAKAAHIKANAQVKVLKAKTEHAKVAGVKKPSNTKKQAQNKNTPTNQHGSNTSPHKARSSQQFRELVYDKLIEASGPSDLAVENWPEVSAHVIEGICLEMEKDTENSYTRQCRVESERLKELAAMDSDPDVLYALLCTEDEDDVGAEVEHDSSDLSGVEHDLGTLGTGDSEPVDGDEADSDPAV
jgi:hypothetical protein